MSSEQFYHPDMYYMNIQTLLAFNMRPVVCDWLSEVSTEYCLSRETWYLAINYMDRFLSVTGPSPNTPSFSHTATAPTTTTTTSSSQPQQLIHSDNDAPLQQTFAPSPTSKESMSTKASSLANAPTDTDTDTDTDKQLHNIRATTVSTHIDRSNLQLLAVACLFIASKVEDTHPPKAEDFALTTDGAYSADMIVSMERLVLQTLQWRLHAQTPLAFLQMFIKKTAIELCKTYTNFKYSSQLQKQMQTQMEELLSVDTFIKMMNLMDVFTFDMHSIRFYPSALAASAMYTILSAHPVVYASVQEATAYTHEDLSPCIQMLVMLSPLLAQVVPQRQPNSAVCAWMRVPPNEYYTRATYNNEALKILGTLTEPFEQNRTHCHTNIIRSLTSISGFTFKDLSNSGWLHPIKAKCRQHRDEWI